LSYTQRSENNIKEQVGTEETLLEKGAGLRSDVLQAQSQLAAAMALRIEGEGALEIAKNRFRTVFGKTIQENDIKALELTARYRNLVPSSLDDSISMALGSNPVLNAKALDRNIDPLFDLVKEFLEDYSFQDFERLKSLLLQYQAGMEASIVSAGHKYAISLSSMHLSKTSYINELWHGIAQYQMIKALTEQFVTAKDPDQILENLSDKLCRIAQSVLKKNNFKPALIGGKKAIITADKQISGIHDALPENGQTSFFTPDIAFDKTVPFDGWYTNTSVSFVGQSFKTVRITHEDSPGLSVIALPLGTLGNGLPSSAEGPSISMDPAILAIADRRSLLAPILANR
jgi:hypothetical protein